MAQNIKTLQGLSKQLSVDPELLEAFKADPIAALEKVKSDNPLNDRWIYRVIVLALGLTVVSIVIGILLLMGNGPIEDKNIPTILTALGSAAIGAIAGLLAPPPKSQTE